MIGPNSLVLAALLLLGAPATALACSCTPAPPVGESLQHADAVFLGRVLQVTGGSGSAPLQVTLAAERAWKGIEASRVTAWTAPNSAACGVAFEPGKSYLIYALRDAEHAMRGAGRGGLWVSLCSRTVAADNAAEDLAQLGAGWMPPDDSQARSNGDLVLWLGAAVLLLAAFVLGVFVGKRPAHPA